MNWDEAQKKLRLLTITTSIGTVLEIVQILEGGNSLYTIYKKNHIVSKVTASKIKKMWQQGKLIFLKDLTIESALIEALTELADLQRPRPRFFIHAVPSETMLANLPSIDWSIAGLQAAGFPDENTATYLLLTYDKIKAVESKTLLKNREVCRVFVGLHYLVDFQSKVHAGDNPLIWDAAFLYAEGQIEDDPDKMALGMDIIRYEIWRGGEYLNTFIDKHLSLLDRPMADIDRHMKNIKELVNSDVKDIKTLNHTFEIIRMYNHKIETALQAIKGARKIQSTGEMEK